MIMIMPEILSCSVKPSRPNPRRRERINLNFYLNINFLNAQDGKG